MGLKSILQGPKLTLIFCSCSCNRSIEWLGSSVVECSHGKRETLGSSPGRAAFFFRPCDIWWPVWLNAKCHRGGKRTRPDRDSNPGSLAYRASTLPLSYRATRSTGYIFPPHWPPLCRLDHQGSRSLPDSTHGIFIWV